MNNGTILELAKKADLVGPHYTPEMGNVSWPRLKEFAELVVRECAQIARGNEDDTTARQIESRFGVEE